MKKTRSGIEPEIDVPYVSALAPGASRPISSRPSAFAPPAVASMAVVRGRLMELLAAELLPPEECDNAFVVGVFSLLDRMLDALAGGPAPR